MALVRSNVQLVSRRNEGNYKSLVDIMIIPAYFEPLNRILEATILESESQLYSPTRKNRLHERSEPL